MTVGQSERKNILNEHTLDWFGFLSHFNLILIFLTLAPGAWDVSNISVMVLLHLQPPLQPACLSETVCFFAIGAISEEPLQDRTPLCKNLHQHLPTRWFQLKRLVAIGRRPLAWAEIHLLPSVHSFCFTLLLPQWLGSYSTMCTPICH